MTEDTTNVDPIIALGDEAPTPLKTVETDVADVADVAKVPGVIEADAEAGKSLFEVVEQKADDLFTLALADGRMFLAKVKADLMGMFVVGDTVEVTHDGTDETGVPVNPVVTAPATTS